MSRLVTLEGEEMGRSFFKKLKKGLKRGAKIATTPHRFALKTAGKALRMTAKAGMNYTPGGFVIKNVAKGAGVYPKRRKKSGTGFNPMTDSAQAMSPAMSMMTRQVANRVNAAQMQQSADYGDGMDMQQPMDMPQAYSAPGGGMDMQQPMDMPQAYSAPGDGMDMQQPMDMPQAYSATGGGMDMQEPDFGPGDSEDMEQDEMNGYPYEFGDGDLTSTEGTEADAQPSEAAPVAKKKKKKKKKGAWSKVKGAAKWTGGKIAKAGKMVGKVVLGGLDAIVQRVVKEEIKADGGVIRPDLRQRCITKIQAAASVAMIPAPGAVVGKLVDRAIKKLSGKYGFEDYAEDGKNWIMEHKLLVAGGVIAAYLLWSNSKKKRGRRG